MAHMGLIQASVLSDQASDFLLSQDLYLSDQEPRKSSDKSGGHFKNFSMKNASSSSNSNNIGNENFMHIGGSLLSFEQNDKFPQNCYDHDYSIWEDNLSHNYQNQLNTNQRFLGDFNCIQLTTSYSNSTVKENQYGGDQEAIDDLGSKKESFNKRPHNAGESVQAFKKQCTSTTRKPKPNSTPSKDPQSLAAKNRRERISERLKVLQDLVPNGTKVDMVTMLEKAISYVKFLQLQVKVLATDEFWPVQGGKAPELSQVKEAIDAILSSQSQRDTN